MTSCFCQNRQYPYAHSKTFVRLVNNAPYAKLEPWKNIPSRRYGRACWKCMHIWPKRRHSACSVLHSLIFFGVFALAEGIFKKENENYIMVLVEKIFNRRNDVKVGVRILK